MKTFDPSRALAIAAGVVIISLTGAAFWLSYAHLAEVALSHGLGKAEVRAWAWPATIDLFIVAGEIMWLRAALAHRVDAWAIVLTAVGSLGSIVLNVAGVTGSRDPSAVPLLDYVVAAVPPTAALLAFGALMRQVHQALAGRTETAGTVTPAPPLTISVDRPEVPTDTPVEVPAVEEAPLRPELTAPTVSPLVICGDQQVWHPEVPAREDDEEVTGAGVKRLPTEAASNVIRAAWLTGTSVTETARQATRSTSYVKKVFARLDEERQQADIEFLAKSAAPWNWAKGTEVPSS
ncbi:DUF2637 domain-containing protein [Streptomyces sp. t39]|uniref:DUF2637 domain-containing protein n=1 Tax=Streptomyces sp. t39 TaxID=1828156 RepID=UPI0011CDE980|nr:DUF2637 domain-containing protein [Streptomyces sp. t39]TXS42915.1 DUF2637 domain-containing protein [Streptomyces sp. t39]